MPENEYITILIQSLQKKKNLLDEVIKKNAEQRDMLEDENLGPDQFEKTVDEKSTLIDRVNELDNGFEQIFQKVKPVIENNMDKYADEIHRMQDLIREITDRSMQIQKEEILNKQCIEAKFSSIKHQIREVKSSQKAVNTYYKHMMDDAMNSSTFIDRKK